jgi:hypothetical protein
MMGLAKPQMPALRSLDANARPSVSRWYDPDSVSFIVDGASERRPVPIDRAYSPVNRGGRFSTKAAMPSA